MLVKTVPVHELLDEEAADLQLRLVASQAGLDRVIDSPRIQKPGLALTGYTDFVQPGRVQIFGTTEITYLEKQTPEARVLACTRFCAVGVPAILCTKGIRAPDALAEACVASGTALLVSPQTTDVFIARVEGWLEERLAPQTAMHGVLIEIYGLGVLVLGKSGIGKSELALDLVQRGHPLIADDLVTIRRRGAETLVGSSNGISRHHIEIRGLGILNVKDLFGISAVREKKRIDMVAELVEWRSDEEYDRLGLDDRRFTILDVELPLITVPVRPGRNMSVIVEVAARNQLLKSLGTHSARDFQEKLLQQLARGRRTRPDDVE
jgi:HPr kinase/phosphorylase